ncbi:MAG: hypothetical protein HOA23_16985, partial [Gemmatimonadales bacterium]|nr:hypothetical protein [Gemmatimonadales bacterium]
ETHNARLWFRFRLRFRFRFRLGLRFRLRLGLRFRLGLGLRFRFRLRLSLRFGLGHLLLGSLLSGTLLLRGLLFRWDTHSSRILAFADFVPDRFRFRGHFRGLDHSRFCRCHFGQKLCLALVRGLLLQLLLSLLRHN